MSRTLIYLLFATSLLGGCATGPRYMAPHPALSASAPFAGAVDNAGVSADAPVDRWWTLYDDPVLSHTVEQALAANTDIRMAVARVERARASLREARSERLPTTSLSASASRERFSSVDVSSAEGRENWYYDGGLAVNYEVDLFGRVRHGIEAARGDAAAEDADAAAVRLAVVAETVRAYLDVTSSAERLAVAHETVDLLDHSIRITGARVDVGRSDRLDLIRLTALREQQAAAIPTIEADRRAALLRLATLTGRTPQDLPAELGERRVTPHLSRPIPVGNGAALIARRPDVRAAERRLAADTARIGVATAELYPHIAFAASGGATALGGMDLVGAGASRWSVGPLLSWSFPNVSAARAQIAAARAESRRSLAAFDGTVLTALEETERALSACARLDERVETLTKARDAAQRAVHISLARQREGRSDFLTVLDAERTLAAAEADLVAARREEAFARVDLFRALGGGWGAA